MLYPNFGTISELRSHTNEVLEKAARAPLWLLRKSKPEVVLLSVEKFQELMDIAEDYFLSVKAKDYEQEDKTKVKWISHEEVKKQLNV